jgi:hypothetical protein
MPPAPTPLAGLAAALALGAAPAGGHAAVPGDPVRAVRLDGRVAVDGRLEEPAWDTAPAFDAFAQIFPGDGVAPSERTEVRVLHDDHFLYVGVVAHDGQPGAIARPLARRDAVPYSDRLQVFVDSSRDRRTAYVFGLNAAGVQEDGLVYDDEQFTLDWDAVWEGAAAAVPGGWSAELAIPLSALRFSSAPDQTWGFGVKRVHARTHEELVSVKRRRGDRGTASRLQPLEGLTGLRPVRQLSLQPYVASRLAWRPQFEDEARPRPRLADPIGDVGLDVSTRLGRGLALQGSLNPDFGQVEADQIVQNLTRFELFFPEKRPFFTEGLDLFQPVVSPGRQAPFQLFYSRRIGLDTPILGAVKLTGKVSDTLQVGLVEALVTGAGRPEGADEEHPTRGFRFDARRPLRFGPAGALPKVAPATRSFLAGVLRWRPAAGHSYGLRAGSTLLTGPSCTAAEADLDDDVRPARCDALAGNAVGVDWNVRSADGVWYVLGQAAASQDLGRAPPRRLADGTRIARGDLGAGGYVQAGKMGGEPWRLDVHYEHQSPKLDLNAAGFQRTQNEQVGRFILRWVRPGGFGPFHAFFTFAGVEARGTTDGRGLSRGRQVWAGWEVQLRSYHWTGCTAVADSERWDVRELDGEGVAQLWPAQGMIECFVSTDRSKPVWAEVGAGWGRSLGEGPFGAKEGYGVSGKIAFRPQARLETGLDVRVSDDAWPARFVDEPVEGTYLLADLRAPSLSLTLRQQVLLAPRLTLQAYAQLFTAHGTYGPFYEATARGGKVRFEDLRPAAPPVASEDFREGALHVNVVLRWEYRLGATLFLVYSRDQAERAWPDDGSAPPATLAPRRFGGGPVTDTILIKWTSLWSAR